IDGTLPRRAAEGKRFWGELVGICIRAEEVGDDLDVLPEDTRKKGGFGSSVVDGPGSACARGQANIALSTHQCAAQQKGGVSRRGRNEYRSSWWRDGLRRSAGGCAERTSEYQGGREQSTTWRGLFGLLIRIIVHSSCSPFFLCYLRCYERLRAPPASH